MEYQYVHILLQDNFWKVYSKLQHAFMEGKKLRRTAHLQQQSYLCTLAPAWKSVKLIGFWWLAQPNCLKSHCEDCGLGHVYNMSTWRGQKLRIIHAVEVIQKVLHGKTKAGKDNRLSVMQQKHPASDSNFCDFYSCDRALHIIWSFLAENAHWNPAILRVKRAPQQVWLWCSKQ
jgi:hypothetical protein